MKKKKNKWKIIYTLIAVAIIIVIVFFVWVILNPEYLKILIDKVVVVAFMTTFFMVGWFFMKVGKKK